MEPQPFHSLLTSSNIKWEWLSDLSSSFYAFISFLHDSRCYAITSDETILLLGENIRCAWTSTPYFSFVFSFFRILVFQITSRLMR